MRSHGGLLKGDPNAQCRRRVHYSVYPQIRIGIPMCSCPGYLVLIERRAQRRRDKSTMEGGEKKKLRAQQKVALDGGRKDGSHGEGEGDKFDGVATLSGPTKSSSKSTRGAPATNSSSGSAPASTTETNEAPLLINPDLSHLAAVLDKADVVIEVLDARDPLSYHSHALEARVAVLNKIDACPRKPTAAWAAHLCSEHPTLLSRAAFSFQAAPAPLCMDTTSNTTAGPQRLRSSTRKHMSLEVELDLDTDAGANGDSRPTCKNRSDAAAMTTMTKEPRTPEKENTIRRWLRQGPATSRNANTNVNANPNAGRGGVKTRKMAAVAAAALTTTKTESAKPTPAPALASAAAAMSDHEPAAAEVGRRGLP